MAFAGIDLVIPVADITEIYGTASNKYDTLRLYSSTTRGGTYSLVTSISLVSGDTTYSYTDAAGTLSTWYKVTLFNSVTSNEQPLTSVDPFEASREYATRKELRQKVLTSLGGKVFSASDITTQTVAALLLTDTGADTDYYKGWHIYRPDSTYAIDNDRRVLSYANTTGTLTHGGYAYQDVSASDEQFEILPLDVDYGVFNERINDGLLQTRYLYRYEFGCTSGKQQYNLPGFIEGPEFVKQVWRRYGGSADQYIWRPIEHQGGWAKVRGSNFQCTLDIFPSMSENDVLALEVWRPGEALDSETDFTRVQRLWGEAAAFVQVLDFVTDLDLTRHQTTQIDKMLGKWKGELRKRSRLYGPTPGMRLQIPSPMSGLPRV